MRETRPSGLMRGTVVRNAAVPTLPSSGLRGALSFSSQSAGSRVIVSGKPWGRASECT
jgi:hypothetical protein